ncbi:MAG: hypothetical protein M3Y50_02750 [Acidobacteriota bacterium]|nr:hypothetical protein [Acidobacteriota bacterium]
MNLALARLLTRLYPSAWRRRYGAEFEAFLQSRPGGLRESTNIVFSALEEHILPTQTGTMEQPTPFQSLCARAPWAAFALGPVFLLAAAYLFACLYLWLGWHLFLPAADTPFGSPLGYTYGPTNLYFQAGKFFYFGAPILVGWAVGLASARQRHSAVWPAIGMLLTACMGATVQMQASRTSVPNSLGHIRIHFGLWPSTQGLYDGLFHSLLILGFTLLPYLLLRRRALRSAI